MTEKSINGVFIYIYIYVRPPDNTSIISENNLLSKIIKSQDLMIHLMLDEIEDKPFQYS